MNFPEQTDRSSDSPSLDHFRFGSAEIAGTEDSAAGKSSLSECFSGLVWSGKVSQGG